jgi:hypothetical protein
MRRVIILLWTLSLVALCAAQDGKSKSDGLRPDFSGNWVLDHAKSALGPLERNLANAEVTLVVAHKDPEIKITRKANVGGRELSQILNYYSDGRGEINPPPFGAADIKTKTKWDKAKLVSSSSQSVTTPRGETFYIDTSEKRELSGDGKTLTITVSISSPRGPQVIKQVYTRAQ